MRVPQARELGARLETLVQNGEHQQAYALLAPILTQQTPFAKLDLVGKAVGEAPLESTNSFLDRIAADKTEGGWVVIGSALGVQVNRDLEGAFTRCQAMINAADVWYGADILAERVPGPALVSDFQPSIERLAPWREDTNCWVRRAVGVATHFWAKRCRGEEGNEQGAKQLLAFLKPMFWEWEMDTAKGVGWGLKTLGRFYPDLVSDWLLLEIIPQPRRYRRLMLHKATTYLSEGQRALLMEEAASALTRVK
jgi:hypothetical protein